MTRPVPHRAPAGASDAERLEALLGQWAQSARSGVNAAIAGTPEARGWEALDMVIARLMARRRWPAPDLAERERRLARQAYLRLGRYDTGRASAYADQCRQLADRRESWAPTAPPAVLAYHVHHALLWHTAWHLLAAGERMSDVLRLLGQVPSSGVRAAPLRPEQQATPPTAGAPTANPWRSHLAAMGVDTLRVAEATVSGAGALLRRTVQVWQAYRGRSIARRQAREAEVRAMEVARHDVAQREAARQEEERQEAIRIAAEAAAAKAATTAGSPSVASGVAISLDGSRLHKPIETTWLMLVLGSWLSLVAGAVLWVPALWGYEVVRIWQAGWWLFSPWWGTTGLNIAIAQFMNDIPIVLGVGLVVVPLVGTMCGFGGMLAARDSTLGGLRFQVLPEDHKLRSTCGRFAEALSLPMPTIGTIEVHNALAMGGNARSATVAIGTPLLQSLNDREVEAVLGHELGHIASGDMARMMLMRTFQNALVWYAGFQGLKQAVRWIICWFTELSILAFSREREYWADAIGAALAGKEAMIGALRKLDQAPKLTSAERTHARFMFHGRVFSTHPSMPQRIKALEDETYLKRLPRKATA